MSNNRLQIFVWLHRSLDTYPIRVFLLPRAMNDFDLNAVSDIVIKLAPVNALIRLKVLA